MGIQLLDPILLSNMIRRDCSENMIIVNGIGKNSVVGQHGFVPRGDVRSRCSGNTCPGRRTTARTTLNIGVKTPGSCRIHASESQ